MDEQSIFLEALEQPSSQAQAAFLDEACGEDEILKRRLIKMLRKHGHAKSFLEQPAPGLEATIDSAHGPSSGAPDAGHASASEGELKVVSGDANLSVLGALGNTVDEVPRVSLRSAKSDLDGPIARPNSPEIPNTSSDSRYQLLGEIARGGMGAIIKGRDTDLGRDLAIKVLLDEHKSKPAVVQRFIEEAQIGGQLQHPGIAPIHELGQFQDQRPFFSMKLVKGQTLSALLSERSSPAEDQAKFIGIFEQIAQTMAYAHSRGVLHRDLKPSNIMVGAFGEVQVMDWGLAKVLNEGGVEDEMKASPCGTLFVTILSLSQTPKSLKMRDFGSSSLFRSPLGTKGTRHEPSSLRLTEMSRFALTPLSSFRGYRTFDSRVNSLRERNNRPQS